MSEAKTLKEIEKIRFKTIGWGLIFALTTVTLVALVRAGKSL